MSTRSVLAINKFTSSRGTTGFFLISSLVCRGSCGGRGGACRWTFFSDWEYARSFIRIRMDMVEPSATLVREPRPPRGPLEIGRCQPGGCCHGNKDTPWKHRRTCLQNLLVPSPQNTLPQLHHDVLSDLPSILMFACWISSSIDFSSSSILFPISSSELLRRVGMKQSNGYFFE